MLKSLDQLNRLSFWLWTIPIVIVHELLNIVVAKGARVGTFDTVVILLLAYVVACRFRDIGWPAWLGPVFILVTMLVIPAVVMDWAFAQNVGPEESLQWLRQIADFIGLVVLIVAGSVPGRAVPAGPA
jgi:hypothetical protein